MKFCAIANSACFAKCREMYRISHIWKNGPKIHPRYRFLGVGWLDCPQNWFIPSSHQCRGSYGAFFGYFNFQPISRTFRVRFWAFFKNRPKFHQKSPGNQLKMEISKKGSIGSSALMGWRYKPIFGAIQSSSSEKTVPTLNFKAKFYNMGNPIHFTTFRETCRVCNGMAQNFTTTSFLNSVKSSWILAFQIFRCV